MPVKEISNAAIRDFVGRLTPNMQEAVRKNLLWNVRNALVYGAQQKQDQADLEEFVAEEAAKGPQWATW